MTVYIVGVTERLSDTDEYYDYQPEEKIVGVFSSYATAYEAVANRFDVQCVEVDEDGGSLFASIESDEADISIWSMEMDAGL